MAALPYVTSPGNIDKALNGIKAAAVPERVSQDFVKTILKIPGGSGDQITTFIKKLGMTNPDGSPNETYKKFRNPTSSGAAIATAVRQAYAPLFVRNEFAHQLSDDDLVGLIVEETGQAHDSSAVKLITSTFKHLKSFANFESQDENEAGEGLAVSVASPDTSRDSIASSFSTTGIGLNLGYTINLNLPPTSDPAVFDAIFKSLKANLLSHDDA